MIEKLKNALIVEAHKLIEAVDGDDMFVVADTESKIHVMVDVLFRATRIVDYIDKKDKDDGVVPKFEA